MAFYLPLEDTRTRIYTLARLKQVDSKPVVSQRAKHEGKYWWELSEAIHQQLPGDNEAIVSRHPIAVHVREHLGQSDRGVGMVRHMLKREVDKLKRGQDPAGSGPHACSTADALGEVGRG